MLFPHRLMVASISGLTQNTVNKSAVYWNVIGGIENLWHFQSEQMGDLEHALST